MNEITMKYFINEHMVREEEYIESLILECESPIEELFVTAFYACGAKENIEGGLYFGTGKDCVVVSDTQVKIDKYRVDFLIKIKWDDGDESVYIVELDGHEFHEKTKEQVKKRNERDRFFCCNGITVFHFSGSEVVNDPDECVYAVCNGIIDCEKNKRKKE